MGSSTGVNVQIDFYPITFLSLARAHALTLARAESLTVNQTDFIRTVATRICRCYFDYELRARVRRTYSTLASGCRLRKVCSLSTLGWWNGRHVRLRGVCRKACGFKSRPEHYYIFIGEIALLDHLLTAFRTDLGQPNARLRSPQRRFVIECPAPSTTISCYEKLDHLHFGPLFSGDDAGFVQ